MYCDKCGARLEETAVFCTECGNRVAQDEKKLIKPKNKILIIILGIFIILCVVGLLFLGGDKENSTNYVRDDEYTKVSNNKMTTSVGNLVNDETDEEMEILFNSDSVLDYQSYTEDETIYHINGDGSIAIGYDEDEKSIFKIENGQKQRLSNEEFDFLYDMKISYSGKAAAFAKADGTYGMYYVDMEKQQITLLDTVSFHGFTLSPEGKCILGIGDYKNKLDNKLYLYEIENGSGQRTLIDEGVTYPVAVNDQGNAIFYIKEDGKLYFSDGEKSECISENTLLVNPVGDMTRNLIVFNEDCTDVLYLDGTTLSRYKVSEGKVNSFYREFDRLSFGVPNDMAFIVHASEEDNLYVEILGKKNLDKVVVQDENAIYYVDDFKLVKVTEVMREYNRFFYVSNDFESILYDKGAGEQYRIYISKLEEQNEERCIYQNENISDYTASLDLSKIYVVCENDSKVVCLKDEEVVQEWEILIYQGVYSDLYDTYVCSTTWFEEQGEIYMLTSAGKEYLGKSLWTYPISNMGNGQLWFYTDEVDGNEKIESVYSLVGKQEVKKLFSRK